LQLLVAKVSTVSAYSMAVMLFLGAVPLRFSTV